MDSKEGEEPTLEGLLEENQSLKTTVEALQQENLKQQKFIKKCKKVFQRDWSQRFKEYQQKKKELPRMLELEEALKINVELLQQYVGHVSKEVREKEEEAQSLARKLKKLTEGGNNGNNWSSSSKVLPKNLTTVEILARKSAVLIFPEEVWKMILDNLTAPGDLWNCCNTCQLFEDILRPWKTGWMWGQALPHLYRHLTGNKLLETRLVSKGWNSAVDTFLDSHLSILPHSSEKTDPRRIDFVYPIKEKGLCERNIFSFTPEEDLSFLEALVPNKFGRNPIIGRYVVLELWKPENHQEDELAVEEERWNKLYNFLETFGKEIWHLSIYFPEAHSLWIHDRIKQLLTVDLFQLVPNLRKLSMSPTGWGPASVDPDSISPSLHLETLETDFVAADGIANAYIERFHSQLGKIQLSAEAWIPLRDLEWPNLKELLLYFEDNLDVDPALSTLPEVMMPNLSKLVLCPLEMTACHFSRILAVINQLGTTTRLDTLQLAGPLVEFGFEQINTNLTATPKLKTLDIFNPWDEGSSILPSFNFLRCFPLIQNLNINVRRTMRPFYSARATFEENDLMSESECKARAAGMKMEEEVVEVNKYAFDGQLYKSNIWELLPRLKVLTFQWDVYTREGYNAYRKNNC